MVMKKRDQNSERRNWARVDPSAVPFLKAVRFNYGKEVRVIDISQGGILVETEVRLQVQGKISLKVITGDGVIGLEGSVVRSSISSLTGGPKYKSAIAFEHPFTMLNTISQKSVPIQKAEAHGFPRRRESRKFSPLYSKGT